MPDRKRDRRGRAERGESKAAKSSAARGRDGPRLGRNRGQPERRGQPRPTDRERRGAAAEQVEGPQAPPIPDDITGRELEPSVRRELHGLPSERATAVARHLVAAGRLLDDDPEAGYGHALAARRLAPRLAVVREAIAIAAYRTERYDEALSEFRALRRLSGSNEYWPVMADCERGIGRPERALQMAKAPEVQTLDPAARAEMLIVAAGARRDLGQIDAAIATLQVPELRGPVRPWTARLRYAYADALRAAGRIDESNEWFARAAAVDEFGETPAAAELAEVAAPKPEGEGRAREPEPGEDVRFLDDEG